MIPTKQEALDNLQRKKQKALDNEIQKLTQIINSNLETTTTFDISIYNYSSEAITTIHDQLVDNGFTVTVLPDYLKIS